MESVRSDIAGARLAALQTNLKTRGVLTRLDWDALAVLDTDTGEQVDTITCKPWPVDRDALWFFDCTDAPVAEAGDVIGAAVAVLGTLARSRARA